MGYICIKCSRELKDGEAFCPGCGHQRETQQTAEERNRLFFLAEQNYNAGNYAEAERYCNTIIEKNTTDNAAWVLKGKAIGWQSTLNNLRLMEAVSCFMCAHSFVNSDLEEVEIINEAKDLLFKVSSAVIDTRATNFVELPIQANTDGLKRDIDEIKRATCAFNGFSKLSDENMILKQLAWTMADCAYSSYRKIYYPQYISANGGYPTKFDYEQFLDRALQCTNWMEIAIEHIEQNDTSRVKKICSNIINICNNCLDSGAYTLEVVEIPGGFLENYISDYTSKYQRTLSLSNEARAIWEKTKTKYERKLNGINSAEKQRRQYEEQQKEKKIAHEYWEDHQEQKNELIASRKELEHQYLMLSTEKNTIKKSIRA